MKDTDGNKTTPRKIAQGIIFDRLFDMEWAWCDGELGGWGHEYMTEKQIEAVTIQLKKEMRRVDRLLGFIPRPYTTDEKLNYFNLMEKK